MSKISLFPKLTEKLMGQIGYESQGFSLYYRDDNVEYPLETTEISDHSVRYTVEDERGFWNPDDYGFIIRNEYTFQSIKCLFGEDGIAGKNASIGVAVTWSSPDSKQRGAIPVGEFKANSHSKTMKLSYRFDKAELRGVISFSTVLYIKKSCKLSDNELHLANKEGTLLGELDKFEIIIDGNGSMFPIYEVEEPRRPLWYVNCDWEDPKEDKFIDKVSIFINKKHKNYQYLDRTANTYDDQLMIEVISGALSVIIYKLKEDKLMWDDIRLGEDIEEGSVAEAVNYFIDTLGWDISSPENLSMSIHSYFDKGM